ncbi:MAG TPA: MlaD family protein [Vicinamibacterales bacterium]|nr:MlaD family protein [Vicinamibacterales bacterium]
MPRTRSLAWSELRIGVLTIVSLVIAAVLIFSLTGTKGFSWQRYRLNTRFADVAGLTAGSPVRVAGVEVGSVKSINLDGDQVLVGFEVNKNVRQRITDQSIATLGSVSLLGQSAVDITPEVHGTPIEDGGFVKSGRTKGSIADISGSAQEGIDQVSALLKDVRAGKGTVGKLMTDDQLYTELRQFTATANDVTAAIKSGKGTLGQLVNDRQTVNALNGSLKNLQDMTARINAGEGSLGLLLKDQAFAKSLTGATDNLRTLTDRLNSGQGTAGKLMTDTALYDRMNQLTGRLDDVISKLNNGEGTAGQLLKDKQLYENMNKAVAEFQQLLEAIKKDPKHYLNVKVSVF